MKINNRYKVPVFWEQVGYAYVEAESIDEAYAAVQEEPWVDMLDGWSTVGEYVVGSYSVDREGINEIKENEN